jgi:hypothetical protein
MKTKLALLFTTMALALPAFADNRNPAYFAQRAAAEQNNQATTVVASSDVKYVPVSNGKGTVTLVPQRDNSSAAASIALSKSSAKGDSCSSCNSGSCRTSR